jgi:hypothetical protein
VADSCRGWSPSIPPARGMGGSSGGRSGGCGFGVGGVGGPGAGEGSAAVGRVMGSDRGREPDRARETGREPDRARETGRDRELDRARTCRHALGRSAPSRPTSSHPPIGHDPASLPYAVNGQTGVPAQAALNGQPRAILGGGAMGTGLQIVPTQPGTTVGFQVSPSSFRRSDRKPGRATNRPCRVASRPARRTSHRSADWGCPRRTRRPAAASGRERTDRGDPPSRGHQREWPCGSSFPPASRPPVPSGAAS